MKPPRFLARRSPSQKPDLAPPLPHMGLHTQMGLHTHPRGRVQSPPCKAHSHPKGSSHPSPWPSRPRARPPSRYYLRDEGLALSWVGTGRCLFSLDFKPADFERVQAALLNAARRMADDGWWWPASGGAIKWSIGKELLKGMVPSFLTSRSTAKGA